MPLSFILKLIIDFLVSKSFERTLISKVTFPKLGVNFIALLNKLDITCCNLVESPIIKSGKCGSTSYINSIFLSFALTENSSTMLSVKSNKEKV